MFPGHIGATPFRDLRKRFYRRRGGIYMARNLCRPAPMTMLAGGERCIGAAGGAEWMCGVGGGAVCGVGEGSARRGAARRGREPASGALLGDGRPGVRPAS